MKNWQFYRDQLIKGGNHIEFSKDYLSSLKTIRAFVASGDGGFGNIACLVHILQRLTELNFQGDFEIIGPDWAKRKSQSKSPLSIIISLMNIQIPYSSGKELLIEKDGIKFKFLSLTDFQERKMEMPQVELAIFAGILRFFNTDYDFFTYHIEDKLCSYFICVTRSQFEKQWSNPNISCAPCEYISPLMDKYSHPNLRLPLSPQDDRVAKAISIVAQEPYCQDLSPYQRIRQCTLQGQLDSSFISGSITVLAYTAGKGFFYGCLESVAQKYLQRKYQLPAATAQFYARFFQLLLQGLMEADWAFEDFYKAIWRMVLTGKNVVAILPALMLLIIELNLNASDGSNVKWIAKMAVNALMFLAGIWPYFYGGSCKVLLLVLPMMLLFVSSQNCGRYIGHQVYEKVTIFAEKKLRRKPAETIVDEMNLNKQV